ncbi:hypothetical protein BCL74_2302 [Oceanibaculum indicum]|uniref:Uncharacterized protein n=2 Tax=Oceanibaculum indicum TaxID=526216 RepID=A0A420WHB2_9PROT|nr:hypothetical protein BCL74_2302 [Oceanibaculum indicum]
MRSRLLALALGLLAAQEASALSYCSEPSVPFCAELIGKFNDQWEYQLCRQELESYRYDVERYIACVREEADSMVQEAVDDYEDAVDSFNMRVNSPF